MSDGITFQPVVATPPSGTVAETDEVDGRHIQLIGLIPGPADTPKTERIGGDAAFGLDVDVTRLPGAGTATLANVGASDTSVTLQAANPARLGWAVTNDSTSVLYVKFGATAAADSFTVRMPAGSYYELPFGYVGIIDGIWAVADGAARVTEVTA